MLRLHPWQQQCLLLCIIAMAGAQAALTTGERNALSDLLRAFPALSLVQQDPSLYYLQNGTFSSWPSTFDSLCSGNDGYEILGIRCENGHVRELFFSDAWGLATSDVHAFDRVSGLTFLNSFRANAFQDELRPSFDRLASALFANLNLELVSVESNVAGPTWYLLLEGESSLLSLRATLPSGAALDYTNLTLLETLDLTQNSALPISLSSFLPLNGSLRSLTISETTLLCNLTNFERFVALESAKFSLASSCASTSPEPLTIMLPPSLHTLSLSNLPNTSVSLNSTGTALQSLEIRGGVLNLASIPGTVTTLILGSGNPYNTAGLEATRLDFEFPKALETITIAIQEVSFVHHSLGACHNLSALHVFNTNLTLLLDSLPSLSQANISKVYLSSTTQTAEDVLDHFFCQSLDPSKLTSIGIYRNVGQLPGCTSSYARLRKFEAAYLTYDNATQFKTNLLERLPPELDSFTFSNGNLVTDGNVDWTWFVTQFPSLKFLSMAYAGLTGTFPSIQLSTLPLLNTLDLSSNSLTGTIEEPFFDFLPQLSVFKCANNLLSGTFPWYGFQALTYLDCSENLFTSWPSIAGNASSLKYINMRTNDLRQIPDDLSFAAMTSLQYLILGDNQHLGGPMPQFWANHSMITIVDLSSNALRGTLPSAIFSRRLSYLDVQTNQLCGSLFGVPTPIGLNSLFVGGNALDGSIPACWTNLTVTSMLQLASNHLSGTLPSPFLSNLSFALSQLDLTANLFSGGVPDLSSFPKLAVLALSSNTYLDLCIRAPNFTTEQVTCRWDTAEMCNCPDAWIPPCAFFNCTGIATTPTPVAPPPLAAPSICTMPPPRPIAISLPPPPPPGPVPLPPPTAPSSTATPPTTFPTSSATLPAAASGFSMACSIVIAIALMS